MRIFYASDTTPNAALNSNLWRNNLYLPLVDLGHDVVEFQYDLTPVFQHLDPSIPQHKSFIDVHRPETTAELLRQVKIAHQQKPIDLFFSYFYDACVFPQAIDEIKSMGIVTANWYCNSAYQLHLVCEISPHYDWCLFPEKAAVEDYKAIGANPLYTQEAANPNIYIHYNIPYDMDVAFIGQAYGERPGIIKYLFEAGINIRAFGYGWQNLARMGGHPIKRLLRPLKHWVLGIKGNNFPKVAAGPALTDEEMIKTYSRAKINLGFSSAGETHKSGKRILHLRLRDFEVPMSGGFYMVEQMDELADFFKIGEEIVCYEGREDLLEKIKYYLSHDTERERIRRAGYDRAHRDHTWQKRFTEAFNYMGLSG